MSLFTEWNLLLLEEYFSPAKADQDVWIPTTRLELEGIGGHKGGANGLIEAVKQGPSWLTRNDNIAVKAHKLVEQRKFRSKRPHGYAEPLGDTSLYKGANAPTYLPYLALWVLAKSEEQKNGFYAQVSRLVCASFPNNTRLQMEAVWKDLEIWASHTQKGKFGRFKCNVLGEHRFVGMAYAQAMITQRDIDGIGRLFGSCRLHPGQILDDDLLAQLFEHGQNSHYLSVGLKLAMGKEDYREHLKQLLGAYLEFWDGYVPKAARSNSIEPSERQNIEVDELSIVLKLKSFEGNSSCEIGWRIPAIVTGLNYTLKVNAGQKTKAKLELAGTHIHSLDLVGQSNARNALKESATREVESILSYEEIEGGISHRKFYLRRDKIRVLVLDSPDPSLEDSLLEREMPLAGPAYFLYSCVEYSNLDMLLKNENIPYKLVKIGGLPDDWGLIYIDAMELLEPENRAKIVDEELRAIANARIRFIGGKPIMGAGSKKYAYYDLPIIELESPVGTELMSKGLTFEELNSADNDYIRRFKFELVDVNRYAFKIEAINNNEVLCAAGLQVLTIGGIASSQNRYFSIDKFGRSSTDSNGLCGAIIGKQQAKVPNKIIDYFHFDERVRDCDDWTDLWVSLETNVSSQFLDTLAASIRGSVAYGAARDQIRRLSSKLEVDNLEPALLVRELRRRGHVEIETNVKGHMVSIRAVQPTLYSLPISNEKRSRIYGICGSLRLQQWKELILAKGCTVIIDRAESFSLPVVRVVVNERVVIEEIAKAANFLIVEQPIWPLSQWLGSMQDVKLNLNWYPEQGLCPKYLKKLNPGSGLFGDVANTMVDHYRKYELFKYEDQQIQGLSVYKLGENLGDGFSKYSFIQDSRWGVWLAINAFAEWIKKSPHSIDDASPWPFHYDQILGSLWMPARMEPPFVIERVLVLCAGDGPLVIQVTGENVGNSILLSARGKGIIGNVSCVYHEMKDANWLCYRWVPKDVANHVASLLGGELKDF